MIIFKLFYSRYKLVVAEALIAKLKPIREKFIELQNSPEYLESVLNRGNEKAQEIAKVTWSEVERKVGFATPTKRKTKEKVIASN